MKNAVVLSCDERLVFALGNVIYQLRDYNFIDDIVIYLKNFDNKLKDRISKISSKIRVIDFNDKDVIEYLKFNVESNNFLKVYGYMVFAKFLAFDLLEEYDNIILLDVDILILKDFSFILSNTPISYKSRGRLNQYLECSDEYTVPNAGVVAINKSIFNYIKSPKIVAFEAVNTFYNKVNIDEIVLGYMVYKNKLPLRLMNNLPVNISPVNENSLDSAIVHGALPNKFWSHPVASFLFPKWKAYNNNWNDFCDDNDLGLYKHNLNIKNELNPKILFNMFFAINVYKEIWNCHHDLKIYINLSDIIKIFIDNIPHSIHFEIKQFGYDYKLMLHDESPKRNDNSLSNFSVLLNKINLKVYVFPNRFEGSKVIKVGLLHKELSSVYNALKNDLLQYSLFYKS